jgi:hypothetical protein
MIFGMSAFLFLHVLLSLIGIFTGFVVLCGLLTAKRLDGWTLLFLVTTAATSVTGFFFPFHGFTPTIGVGIVSMVVVLGAIAARYSFHLVGHWRGIYAAAAVIALYLNTFVLVAQAFQKVPALHALAPQGTEPPFAVAQGILLLLFVVAGVYSLRRFRPVV